MLPSFNTWLALDTNSLLPIRKIPLKEIVVLFCVADNELDAPRD